MIEKIQKQKQNYNLKYLYVVNKSELKSAADHEIKNDTFCFGGIYNI